MAVFDERWNFKQVDDFIIPGSNLRTFISAGYGKAFVVLSIQEYCEGSEMKLQVFYKLKRPKLIRTETNKTCNALYFTKNDDYFIKISNVGGSYLLEVLATKDMSVVKSTQIKTKGRVVFDVSPQGNYFIAHNLLDKTSVIYSNDKDLEKLKTFSGIENLTFSNDEEYLAVEDSSEQIEIYKTKKFKLEKRLYPESNLWLKLFFSPENKFFVASGPGTKQIYAIGKDYSKITLVSRIKPIFYDNDKKLIYYDSDALAFCTIKGDKIKVKDLFYLESTFLARYILSPDEKFLLIKDDKIFYVYDIKAADVVFKSPENYYEDALFDKDGKYLFYLPDNKPLIVYSIKNNFDEVKQLQENNAIKKAAISPDNKLLFGYGKELYVYSVKNDFSLIKEINKGAKIKDITFSPEMKFFIMQTSYGPILYKLK